MFTFAIRKKKHFLKNFFQDIFGVFLVRAVLNSGQNDHFIEIKIFLKNEIEALTN